MIGAGFDQQFLGRAANFEVNVLSNHDAGADHDADNFDRLETAGLDAYCIGAHDGNSHKAVDTG
jgi:hypothetical protein